MIVMMVFDPKPFLILIMNYYFDNNCELHCLLKRLIEMYVSCIKCNQNHVFNL
jgi:hypothetical protein